MRSKITHKELTAKIIMLSGSDIVIEILKSENVSFVFGNPGTTELALVDALSEHRDIKYILGLQEASVVGLADGYARATNRPAFVNLHATAGLGNGLGALSNAAYMNTPLVVTAGQQDYRHIVDDPWLTGDLVGLAKPLCKWAHEVRTVDELGVILRRAFKDANTFPKGPVFVALPSNFMEEETTMPVPPKSEIYTDSVAGGISELAGILSDCKPSEIAIIAGDEISSSNALQEVVEFAEMMGADVYGS
ncbi:MAG: thiamine pyrophosphate-binding protein, partial [Arenicella sp.]|nr:thiamine pyrophosphate-binding protein [Arenicella sp.]